MPTPPTSSESAACGTILVVEDDDGVRQFVCAVLEQAGHVVLAAASSDQALDLYSRDPDRVDLVLTDVVMPKRSGPELVAELRRLRPGVRVAYMSGYTCGTPTNPIDFPPGIPLLEKPFSLDSLLQFVAAACAG